jgi:glycerol-3-phosphate dehydrogenase
VRDRLLHRYGALAADVAAIAAADGGAYLTDGGGYLRAEAVYAVTHEGALTIEDVLARRTRIALEADDGGAAAAAEVAEILRPLLDWPAERAASEVAAYRRGLEAERSALRLATAAPAVSLEGVRRLMY